MPEGRTSAVSGWGYGGDRRLQGWGPVGPSAAPRLALSGARRTGDAARSHFLAPGLGKMPQGRLVGPQKQRADIQGKPDVGAR
jgi:hypothetical protein